MPIENFEENHAMKLLISHTFAETSCVADKFSRHVRD